MINKEKSRQRRARATRARIKLQKVNRLSIHRTNLHIYASIISADGGRVLVSASTVEREVRDQLAAAKSNGGNVNAAKIIGTRIAERRRRLALNPALSTVPDTVITAALLRWPRPRAKPVSSSKD